MAGPPPGVEEASWRNGVYVPQMPWFEPSTEPSAKASMLSQTVHEGDQFSFPADRDFWDNFVTQARLYPGAMDPPHFHVDASHTDESLLVNQEFLRRFVSGWERANPHVVRVQGPAGSTTLHASEEFWNRFVTLAGQRSRERAVRGEFVVEDMLISSGMYPSMPPIKTTQRDWIDICQSWEADKGLIPGQRMQRAGAAPDASGTLISQQNQTLDFQRRELADKRQRTEQLRAQVEGLRRELGQIQTQAEGLRGRAQSSSRDLQTALSDAERSRQESEQLRHQLTLQQQGWETEKASLENRLASMEKAVSELQGEHGKERDKMKRELTGRSRQLQETVQQAQITDLKRELRLREELHEELCRARAEAAQQAEEAMREEMTRRTQQELEELRRLVREQPLFPQPACPPQPFCPPAHVPY
eukprot:Hpha_TRINITY_DN16887_c3_g1::TRINITY_DN16887_c3_g1_i1::g.153472::m.153472